MPVMGRQLVPALLLAGFAATAGAQQKACDIDESTPAQLTRAVLDIQIAQQSSKPADAASKLKDAIKLLGEGDKTKNPVGRAYELGRTLVLWTTQPDMAGGMTTRGAVGFVDNPTAAYDLYAGVDSAFTVVEASNPECVATTAPWRQQKAWVDMVNRAIEFNNQDKMDSAVYLAKRSLILSRSAPYGYMVLAQAAQKASRVPEAIEQYKLSVTAAAAAAQRDTAQADTKRQLQLALGNLATDAAEAASGAEKTKYLADAKEAFDALAKDPGAKFGEPARAGQARVAQLSGDTGAIKATYADQLANPSAFSYAQLMNAAVTAARTNQNADALKLFEAARTVNPYHRDVLYNLSRLYLLDSAWSKGIPVARQLISIDPSNPDDYQLMAIAYSAIYKGYATKSKMYDSTAKALGKRANAPGAKATVVKAAVDSAARIQKFITAYGDSAKVNLDSALKYQTAMTSLPARVTFSEFTPTDGKVSIGGAISNEGTSAKTFTLKIDFLDKTGAVVSSQSVDVGPIDAKGSKPFKAEGTGAGIVAFKYSPVT